VRVVSYEITEEPLPDATFEQLPSDVQAQINALHDEVLKARPRKALAALRTLITQYPDVAQIYNYLYVACYNLGDRAEAARVARKCSPKPRACRQEDYGDVRPPMVRFMPRTRSDPTTNGGA